MIRIAQSGCAGAWELPKDWTNCRLAIAGDGTHRGALSEHFEILGKLGDPRRRMTGRGQICRRCTCLHPLPNVSNEVAQVRTHTLRKLA
jgi:hypothetical protein